MELARAVVGVVAATVATFALLTTHAGVRVAVARRRVVHLLHRDPHRCRALLRVLSRRRVKPSREWFLFAEAAALLWEGEFTRASTLADAADVASGGRLRAAATALKLHGLLFMEQVDQARRLFDAQRGDLDGLRVADFPELDGQLVKALLCFHEGDSRPLGSLGDEYSVPVVSFYRAAKAHREDRPDEVRDQLDATIASAGRTFLAEWARDTFEELLPGCPPPPRARGISGARRRGQTFGWSLVHGLVGLFFMGPAGRYTFRFEQVAMLVLVDLAVVFAPRLIHHEAHAILYWPGIYELAAPILMVPLAAMGAAAMAGVRARALDLWGAFAAALPALLALDAMVGFVRHADVATVLALGLCAWTLAAFMFLVRRCAPNAAGIRLAGAGALAALWLWGFAVTHREPLWFAFPDRGVPTNNGQELEAFLFDQADKVRAAEGKIAADRPGVADLYFVGFAGWDAPVFRNETTFASELFARRFDTRRRSLVLSNDPSDRDALPLALKINLRHALHEIGSRMNPTEDVLFLFLSSHGSRRGLGLRSSARFGPLDEDDLAPTELRSMLDEAKIKWRVVVVSGCESGVFVDALRDESTLVATAAASDRVSFGCSPRNDFTEYGRAVFAEELTHERSFPVAFARANDLIRQRELQGGLTPSLPQLSVGTAISEKLHEIEARVVDDSEPSAVREAGSSADAPTDGSAVTGTARVLHDE